MMWEFLGQASPKRETSKSEDMPTSPILTVNSKYVPQRKTLPANNNKTCLARRELSLELQISSPKGDWSDATPSHCTTLNPEKLNVFNNTNNADLNLNIIRNECCNEISSYSELAAGSTNDLKDCDINSGVFTKGPLSPKSTSFRVNSIKQSTQQNKLYAICKDKSNSKQAMKTKQEAARDLLITAKILEQGNCISGKEQKKHDCNDYSDKGFIPFSSLCEGTEFLATDSELVLAGDLLVDLANKDIIFEKWPENTQYVTHLQSKRLLHKQEASSSQDIFINPSINFNCSINSINCNAIDKSKKEYCNLDKENMMNEQNMTQIRQEAEPTKNVQNSFDMSIMQFSENTEMALNDLECRYFKTEFSEQNNVTSSNSLEYNVANKQLHNGSNNDIERDRLPDVKSDAKTSIISNNSESNLNIELTSLKDHGFGQFSDVSVNKPSSIQVAHTKSTIDDINNCDYGTDDGSPINISEKSLLQSTKIFTEVYSHREQLLENLEHVTDNLQLDMPFCNNISIDLSKIHTATSFNLSNIEEHAIQKSLKDCTIPNEWHTIQQSPKPKFIQTSSINVEKSLIIPSCNESNLACTSPILVPRKSHEKKVNLSSIHIKKLFTEPTVPENQHLSIKDMRLQPEYSQKSRCNITDFKTMIGQPGIFSENEFQHEKVDDSMEEFCIPKYLNEQQCSENSHRESDHELKVHRCMIMSSSTISECVNRKCLRVSETALEKSDEIIDNIDNNISVQKAKIDSLEKPTNMLDKSKFQGFGTASGKPITVSENALGKATKIFDNIDEISDQELKSNDFKTPKNVLDKCKFQGFGTASGKSVTVSKNALEKANKIFDNIDEISDHEISDQELKSNDFKTPKNVLDKYKFQGFGTASGKSVTVSKSSIEITNKTFDNTDEISDNKMNSNSFKKPTNMFDKCKFQGFGTASGKSVTVSKSSIEITNKTFDNTDEISDNEMNSNYFKKPINMFGKCKFQGFGTASGKSVTVSTSSLEIANKIFANIDEISDNEIKSNSFKKPINMFDECQFQGFGTASGKSVTVSKSAVEIANKANIDEISEPVNMYDKCKFQGFGTANGKSVKVSKSGLEMATKIFANIDEISDNEIKSNSFKKPINMFDECQFQGFGTASGKSVTVSKSAVEIANKANIDEISEPVNMYDKCKFQGFGTASGKSVKVSKSGLEMATKIFANIDEISDNEIKSNSFKKPINMFDECQFQGFGTASGKSVTVSKSAVEIANKANIDEISEPVNMFDKCKFQGFGTANGKSVAVSESALEKARKIFDNMDDDLYDQEAESDSCKKPTDMFDKSKFQGFGSVIGKPSSVTEIFDNIEKSVDEQNTELLEKSTTKSDKFKLRSLRQQSGQPITASESSLNKTNAIIDHIEIPDILHDGTTLNIHNSDSKNGGTVQVSNNAFQKNKTIFENLNQYFSTQENHNAEEYFQKPLLETVEDIYKNENENLIKVRTPSFNDIPDNTNTANIIKNINSIFSTARGDTVQLSQKSLDHIRKQKEITTESITPVCKRIGSLIDDSVSKKMKISFNDNNVYQSTIPELIKDVELKSLTQEITESTLALISDEWNEEGERPEWMSSCYVTDPSMLSDCSGPVFPIMISDNMCQTFISNRDQATSPILGVHDRFYNRKIKQTQTKQINDVDKNKLENISKSSFKVPYKNVDSTASQTVKRKMCEDYTEYSIPFVKKHKCEKLDYDKPKNVYATEDRAKYNLNKNKKPVITKEVIEMRKAASKKQIADMADNTSNGLKVQPLKGSFLVTRTQAESDRVKWKDIVDCPKKFSKKILLSMGVQESIIDLSFENAANFVFNAWEYYSENTCSNNAAGILIGDGATVILSAESKMGLMEISNAFLTSPGVDGSLVSKLWIKNHYKWIVTKLSSMERNFPNTFAKRALTPNNVMLQLKYRYDREIDRAERSCLKKILEGDEAASQKMVLFCAAIYRLDNTLAESSSKQVNIELELSDGWYGIRTQIDEPLCKAVMEQRFNIGHKIMVQGSQLINSDQGCDPLEVPESVRLKIFSNSSARVPWHTKLGLGNRMPLAKCLGSVNDKGGTVQYTEFVIVRIYSMLYVERSDEKTVIRSEKAALKRLHAYDVKHLDEVEKVYSQVYKTVLKERESENKLSKKCMRISEKEISTITSPTKLHDLVESTLDPFSIQSILSSTQQTLLEGFYEQKQNELSREVETRVRSILSSKQDSQMRSTPLLKLRVVPLCRKKRKDHTKCAMLSVWRPTNDIVEMFSEGSAIAARQCYATGMRFGDLQLSASRQASYSKLPTEKINLSDYPLRVLTSITDMYSKTFKAEFNEVDTIGVVISVGAIRNPVSFQTVYLADINKKVMGVSFWGGLKEFGYEDLFKINAIIACTNLQWRNNSGNKWIPYTYASEMSSFSSRPRQKHFKDTFDILTTTLLSNSEFITECESKMSRFNSAVMPKQNFRTPSTNCGSKFPGLSNNVSNNCQRQEVLVSPIQTRINKLQIYGEPPKLPPIVIATPKEKVLQKFKVPNRPNADVKKPTLGYDAKGNNSKDDHTESPPLSLE